MQGLVLWTDLIRACRLYGLQLSFPFSVLFTSPPKTTLMQLKKGTKRRFHWFPKIIEVYLFRQMIPPSCVNCVNFLANIIIVPILGCVWVEWQLEHLWPTLKKQETFLLYPLFNGVLTHEGSGGRIIATVVARPMLCSWKGFSGNRKRMDGD